MATTDASALRWGVHTGLQNTSIAELRDLWTRIEDLDFDWISIWDHFYAADLVGPHCHEAVAAHAALACHTTKVRCGSLVYCAAYRTPAVLANAITTIDHLCDGRADLGLGAGWAQPEFEAYGYTFGSPKERVDLFEETLIAVRGLLQDETTSFDGEYVTLREAKLEPKPVQDRLPIWVGGSGRRMMKIVARHADGWNTPFLTPEQFGAKRQELLDNCDEVGRDPSTLRFSVNVGAATDEESLKAQFGAMAEAVRGGVLFGDAAAMADQVAKYVEAGADQINLALRAPWHVDVLDALADARAEVATAR
jgi:alkanesulfonate monooxygenase SsuD/methylene tetrahydromethanopterin reductase-like flavin-dependent oxidoreductase (luciferase family)